MKTYRFETLHVLVLIMLIFCTLAAAVGVFSNGGGAPFDVTNSSGDVVRINGSGIYALDSYFKAPIFRGSDLTMLVVAVPLLIFALLRDLRAPALKHRVFLSAVIGVFLYYSASIAFGVTYNALLLVYIGLFSASFFGLILAAASIDYALVAQSIQPGLPQRAISVFLWITGVALFVAWMPDILSALAAGRSLEKIEVYTTEITYVLDMGLISPAAIATYFLLKKPSALARGAGFVLLTLLLGLCLVVGVMLPVQSAFQLAAGISLPPAVLITKIGIFILLALAALYLTLRLQRAWKKTA